MRIRISEVLISEVLLYNVLLISSNNLVIFLLILNMHVFVVMKFSVLSVLLYLTAAP